MRLVPVHEQLAVAAAGAEATESFVQGGRPWRDGISVTEGMAMRAVAPVFVELARHVAAQTFALAHAKQLGGELAHETFGFVDNRWDSRHS
jgi:hypothetical protein